jgi:uracil-DNA glycosylase family 4
VERSLADEARAVLGSARAWLEEFAEEGLERVEPPASERESKPAASSPAPGETVAAEPESAPVAAGGAAANLAAVRAELGECTRCALHAGRTNIVFGDGNPDADLLFVGEGPGEQEDRQGLPFVGRAGELLTQMIEKGLEIPRSSVYICNIVKCRPPGNRNPLPDEVASCSPFLTAQIAAVKPKVIVSLGKPAASLLLGREVAITRIRGTWHEYRGIALMPTLHPAYVLRQYTAENRKNVWSDLKAALARSRGEDLAAGPGNP